MQQCILNACSKNIIFYDWASFNMEIKSLKISSSTEYTALRTFMFYSSMKESYIGGYLNWRNHILENLCIGGTYTDIHKLKEPYIGEFVYWRNIYRHT